MKGAEHATTLIQGAFDAVSDRVGKGSGGSAKDFLDSYPFCTATDSESP